MGMVKMKHINIYGPEQDPKQTLEALARAECFDPDAADDASTAAAKTQENAYAPLLVQTVGLLKDLGEDGTFGTYEGAYFTLEEVKRPCHRGGRAQRAQNRGGRAPRHLCADEAAALPPHQSAHEHG